MGFCFHRAAACLIRRGANLHGIIVSPPSICSFLFSIRADFWWEHSRGNGQTENSETLIFRESRGWRVGVGFFGSLNFWEPLCCGGNGLFRERFRLFGTYPTRWNDRGQGAKILAFSSCRSVHLQLGGRFSSFRSVHLQLGAPFRPGLHF